MKQQHFPGELITSRYQIVKCLGRGGMGITYQAQDLQNNQPVALKCLSLRRVNDWKSLELFEREAQVLANLKHPSIPQYLNYFQVGTDHEQAFYLVQELAPGKSLFELVKQGWRPNQAKIMDVAMQILDVLTYLQRLVSPVIHRDIKPQNIIYGQHGKVMLVDFGAVRDTYHQSLTGGGTIVGTFGYMAPEQCRGQAILSTDLYGLGATMIFLLTGKSPSELPQRKFIIDFRAVSQPSEPLSGWLDRALHPIIEHRFRSATEALAVLSGQQPMPVKLLPQIVKRPTFSPIKLTKNKNTLNVNIPPTYLNSLPGLTFGLLPVFCSALVMSIIHMFVLEVVGSHFLLWFTPGVLLLLLFWAQVAQSQLFSGLFHTTLEISLSRVTILKTFAFFRIDQNISLDTLSLQINLEQVLKISQRPIPAYEKSMLQRILRQIPVKVSLPLDNWITRFLPLTRVCQLTSKDQDILFGAFLSQAEQTWLMAEIQNFLG